jgi:hypothetical protein
MSADGSTGPVLVRQGDVLLVPVEGVPEGAVRVPGSRVVLAEGEATGHAHVVTGRGARLLEVPGHRVRWGRWVPAARFLVVSGERRVTLRHEEHLPVDLVPGVYEVRRQREYRPQRSVWVAD